MRHRNDSDESILGQDFRAGGIKQTHEVTVDYAEENTHGKDGGRFGVHSQVGQPHPGA